jgi:hypothetical protein
MKKVLFAIVIMALLTGNAMAIQGRIATDEDIANLKKDVLEGKIQPGKTRLKDIKTLFGEPKNIANTDHRVVYDYGDLKVEFDKKRVWKEWDYDSFKPAAYTKDINDLRFDLESKKLIGDNITLLKVKKDYGDPTESFETTEDGNWSVYYYGDIKLVFENYFIIDTIKGKNLETVSVQAKNALASEEKPVKK